MSGIRVLVGLGAPGPVTPVQPPSRQRPTRSRTWLMSRFSSIRSPVHSSKTSCPPFFFAFGIGMKYEDGRRPSVT